MLRASIFQKNILEKSEKSDLAESFNNCLVDINEQQIKIYKNNELILQSNLKKTESDFNTSSYSGFFLDGESFRIIRPNKIPLDNLKTEFNCISAFSIASINPDGYAIHFILTEKDDIRKSESQDKGTQEQIQKLLEACVLSLQNKLHQNFIDYSKRILNLISEGENLKSYKFGNEILEIMRNNKDIYTASEIIKIS
jgi:hypothetical protein